MATGNTLVPPPSWGHYYAEAVVGLEGPSWVGLAIFLADRNKQRRTKNWVKVSRFRCVRVVKSGGGLKPFQDNFMGQNILLTMP